MEERRGSILGAYLFWGVMLTLLACALAMAPKSHGAEGEKPLSQLGQNVMDVIEGQGSWPYAKRMIQVTSGTLSMAQRGIFVVELIDAMDATGSDNIGEQWESAWRTGSPKGLKIPIVDGQGVERRVDLVRGVMQVAAHGIAKEIREERQRGANRAAAKEGALR